MNKKMCLYIDNKRVKRVKETFKKHGGKAVMWKVFRLTKYRPDQSTINLVSPIMGKIFFSGNNDSDRYDTELSVYEEINKSVVNAMGNEITF